MEKEDIYLIEKSKENKDYFAFLYKKYYEKIFNYFWYRVGHQKEIAEDLLQETFFRAYEKLPGFKLRAYSYYSYLLTIAHNVLVNYYRKPQSDIISLESVVDVPSEITIDQEFDKKKNAEILWRAVQQLSDSQKDIVLLRYQKELSIKDIARIVKKSENAVKLILSRTRKKLSRHPYLNYLVNFGDYKKKHTKPKFFKNE